VTTYADQAVIAIENTRLFEAEQAGKRELQESLEYQTPTAEVLGVLSRLMFSRSLRRLRRARQTCAMLMTLSFCA
jgi:hypothetical protein